LLVKGEFYSYFLRTNIITLPDVQFVDFAYDSDMRIIFALAKVPNQENIGKSSTIQRYEMHMFNVMNEITWRKKVEFTKASNITSMSYNPNL
jgi:hypothetical protein